METQPILERVCARILEEWAMMLVDRFPEEDMGDEPTSPLTRGAEIHFTGKHNGTLHILGTDDFAKSLVGNVLGEFVEEDDEDSTRDVLQELANVVMGNLVTELYGTADVFKVDMPRYLDGSALEKITEAPTVECRLVADDKAVVFRFFSR